MDQIIVAMSGRKQAGKNTLGKFLGRYANDYHDKRGTIVPSKYVGTNLPHSFECSFADNLKDFCIDTLGLPYEACYGTEEQKKAPTQYNWEDCSPFLAWKFGERLFYDKDKQEVYRDFMHHTDSERLRQIYYDKGNRDMAQLELGVRLICSGHREGPMSGRDIMQVFGTDLIRETFGNVWAAATIRRIKKAGKPFSVITDNRFPNEVDAVLAEPKGYVIRLTRSPFGMKDIHPSEAALDGFDWDRERCFVLDNATMTLEEQEEAIRPIVDQILA